MNTRQCLEHPWISGVISPETLLGDSETCKNSEENMIGRCDEQEEKSDVIAEKEIPVEIVQNCSESSDSLPSEHKDLNLVLEEPENIDSEDSIPSKILKCNSNSNILDECEKTKGTDNMTCSENECMKDSYKMDDVNSNLSTQAVV